MLLNRLNIWKSTMLVAALFAVVSCAFALSVIAQGWGSGLKGTVGATLTESQFFSGRHEYTIQGLAGNSPLLALGAHVGDHVRFDHLGDRLFWDGGGVDVGLTLIQGQRRSHHVVQTVLVPSRPFFDYADGLLTTVASLAAVLLGLVLGWRRADSPALRALAASFVLLALNNTCTAQVGVPLRDWQRITWFLTLAPSSNMVLRFAMLYTQALQLPARTWLDRAHRLVQVLTAVCVASALYFTLGFDCPLNATLDSVQNMVTAVLTLLVLVLAYRADSGVQRQRLGWFIAAVGLPNILVMGTFFSESPNLTVAMTTELVGDIVPLYAGVGLMAYAALRHRVFDFGLAVSRSLAFTVTSVLLILVFFLLERAAHHLVPFEDMQKYAAIDGGLAFVLFFVFNRLHHRVDHLVSSFFFRSWRENERQLRQFLRRARHMTEEAPLIAAFAAELSRFCQGAPVTLYRRTVDGAYACVATFAQAPSRVEANDSLAVCLRTEHGSIALADVELAQSGEWAFPMLQGATVEGFAIVHAKPDGAAYRDDERELLEFATIQVGLDLDALHVAVLQRQLAEAQFEVTALRNVIRAV